MAVRKLANTFTEMFDTDARPWLTGVS